MNAVRQEKNYTINDIYNLPDGQRAELMDGKLYMMATPSTRHQRLVMELSFRIREYIGRKDGLCEVFPSPFAVYLNSNKEIYVEPDISVICDKNKVTDEGCIGAPDWIIEIVSPSSRTMDYYKKLIKYQNAGVSEYWIADFEKNHIIVYNFDNDEVADYTFSDKVKAGVYEDFEINFSEIKI